MEEVNNLILKYVLQNAVRYGKAEVGPIVGKVIGEKPALKTKTKELVAEIKKIVGEINKLSQSEQVEKLRKLAPELLEKKEEKEKVLQDLPNAQTGRVVMRFAPSPSGPLHVGHSYVLLLCSEYCRKYKGKLLLRVEDTNPENIYAPAYKMLEDEADWITKGNISKVIVQSDRLENYYDYAEKLINQGNAYVCTCDAEVFRDLVTNKKACPCRGLDKKEHQKRWDKMFTEYEPGEAVVRLKTDVNHKNPSQRDFPLLRINHNEHPMQGTKYKVWPLMNFSVSVDDHDLGITHTIRGKDHMDNERKQKYIFDYLGWKMPTHLYTGRINFIGMDVSKTETKKLIEYGKYSGWDDIRLPFLAALRRRGYQPEAFVKYALAVGLNENDKTIAKEDYFKMLDHFNKEIVEKSNRYFFVENPKKIKIANAKPMKVKVPLHPDDEKRGFRSFETKDEFYVQDALKKGKTYRFMHLFNFKDNKFVSSEHDPKLDAQLIHWLPVSKDLIKVELLMPDGKIVKGLGEPSIKYLKVGDVVQFIRIGFCRLDEKSKDKYTFWYAHS